MISGLPALGARFDINRIDSASYGLECWKLFWAAIDPAGLDGTLLWDGDTAASMAGRENVFCIAIQHSHDRIISAVKAALTSHVPFGVVCAPPRFIEGAVCVVEPLVTVGKVSQGKLLGDAWRARAALEAVRKERDVIRACPNCGRTASRDGSTLNIFRCSCGQTYCDECSEGGLIDLPRCPVSVYHDGMKKVGVVSGA